MKPRIGSHSHSQGTLTENTPLLAPLPEEEERYITISQASTGVASPALSDEGTAAGYDGADEEGYDSDSASLKSCSAAKQSIGTLRATGVAFSLFILLFLQAGNMSGMTTLQSSIAIDLDASGSQAIWFTSAYLITMSSLGPIMGRLAQIFSPRYLVLVAASVFGLGGLVASLARSFEVFVLGRVIAGLGAGGILTLTLILVLELTGPKKRGLFVGLVNTAYTIGVSLGAVVAGALVGRVGWRPLFYAQTPLSILAGVGVCISIPSHFTSPTHHSSTPQTITAKLRRLDYPGAILLTTTLVTFLFGLSSAPICPLPIGISLLLFPLFIAYELRIATDPLIPLSLLKSRAVLLTCVAQLGFMSIRWTVLFYTPTYALTLLRLPPSTAGSLLIPTNAGFALGGLLAGAFHIKRSGSFYTASLLSFLVFCASIAAISGLVGKGQLSGFIAVSIIAGLSTGAALNYTLAHLLHQTAKEQHFMSTSLLATFRSFAGAFGSSIAGGYFLRLLRRALEAGFEGREVERGLLERLLASPALVGDLEGWKGEVAREGYEKALRGVFVAGAVVSLLMVGLQAGTGWRGADEGEAGKAVDGEE